MIHTYVIREGAGETTLVDLPTVAHMIDQGRLKYTGQKSKWNAAEAQMQVRRFYIRVNREPRRAVPCVLPCCTPKTPASTAA